MQKETQNRPNKMLLFEIIIFFIVFECSIATKMRKIIVNPIKKIIG